MYLKNFFRDKKLLFLVAFGTFFFLEVLIFIGITYAKKSEVNTYLNVYNPDFKSHVDIANRHLTDISRVFYDIKVDTPAVINIMSEASQSKDKKYLQKLRMELLERLTPAYLSMNKYHIRQLHFHLPHAISFLRFHRPEKYGDSLQGVRATLEYVNEYRTPISAFEEGRIFNGFRNVYPIYKQDKFVGTVEISFSFDAMQEVLSGIDSTSSLFIIKKKVVGKKVFKDEKSNYIDSEFPMYDYDKNTLKDTMQIGLKEMKIINADIAKRVEKRLSSGELFSLYFKEKSLYNNHSIIISFAPVANLNDDVVAYIIHYNFGDFVDVILKNIEVIFLVLTFLAIVLSLIFTFILFNERKKREEIHSLAIHDALTGIYNRYGVNELLKQKIEEYRRDGNSFSIVFFDIDFFKRVNDTYGHDMGDYVLENIAKLVTEELRSSDIFARWGGEEFLLVLPNTKLKSASQVAYKLKESIEKHAFSSIDTITCSFGVSEFQKKDTKIIALKRVDSFLYRAKNSGRNCVVDDNSL